MTATAGSRASELFGIEVPIILGPMAGGPSTPELAATVSNAGGLGILGEAYETPDAVRRHILAVRALTDKPFGVNLFIPEPVYIDEQQLATALEVLAPYRRDLGLPPQTLPTDFVPDFESQLAVVLEERVPVFTFTFGALRNDHLEALHGRDTIVGGTVTTATEARLLADANVDFLIAQGAEAGGHRGTFHPAVADDLIGLMALVPEVRAISKLPVVAAGGIVTGAGIAAAFALGACAAQLGTAFLLCPEAGTSAPYRAAIRQAKGEDTLITTAFSGRRARGVANRFARELADRSDLPPFPVLNALTRELRAAAAARGDASVLSLWAGQGVALVREFPAEELVALLAHELESTWKG